MEELTQAIVKTEAYISREKFRGYDPYDALKSPLFRLPILRSQKYMRLAAQQVLKRLPLNIRPLLGIEKGYNPVTLGLCIQAFSYLASSVPDRSEYYLERVNFCLKEIERLQSGGYAGACWGYDFDWQARYATMPAYMPTVVATGFITNGLFTAYRLCGQERAFELCRSAVDFVMRDLHRTEDEDGDFCWSYSPEDKQLVLNATMKGARLLAQVYSVTGEKALAATAKRTVQFVAKHQRANGSWPYSLGDTRTWADNFHTGYVLDCFLEYERCTGDTTFSPVVQRGWTYYRANFFAEGKIPKYYDNSLYPVDATSCAQSLLTLVNFGDIAFACKVADWLIRHMQQSDGSFVYQITNHYVNRIPYMRWSVAWLFLALSRLAYEQRSNDAHLD